MVDHQPFVGFLILALSHGCLAEANYKRATLRQVFHDDFTQFDHNKWTNSITASGNGNGEFQLYTPDHGNCYVKGGHLYLRPTLTSAKFGESFLHSGTLDLHKTYGACDYDCTKHAPTRGIIPPTMSCKMTTKRSIKYGKIEVWAKMPEGDWLWPAIWLMPAHNEYGTWPKSGEIDMAELKGNLQYAGGTPRVVSSTIHFGTDFNNHKLVSNSHTLPAEKSYADGFYKYVLDWTSSYIRISVNDVMVLNQTTPSDGFYHHYHEHGPNIWSHGGTDAPFDKDFHLILNVAVGGTKGWFPDVKNFPHPKPWHNSEDRTAAMEKFWKDQHNWYRTWHGERAAMQVRSVTMWTY